MWLIDAEPIVKFIKDGLNNPNKEEAFGHTAVQILTEIEYAPAVDAAEVVHAKWEWFEEWNPSSPDHPRECDDCGWRCGHCKTSLADMVGGYWDDFYETPKLSYCPNCGAKMDGGQE